MSRTAAVKYFSACAVLLALVTSAFFVVFGYRMWSFGTFPTSFTPTVPSGQGVGTPTTGVGAASIISRQALPERLSPTVRIAATEIPVEIATTSAAQQKGLSGRPSLDADKGMLFIFGRPDQYSFWMPDMHFPLDIIWIQDGKVVDIDKDVSNEFNPAAPKFYSPSSPVKYVLEVNAGFAMRHGIRTGDAVTFNNLK